MCVCLVGFVDVSFQERKKKLIIHNVYCKSVNDDILVKVKQA